MSADFDWEGKHFAFFQNSKCEYFPCHNTSEPNNFSCLFCFCPLYSLNEECGGNFKYNEAGIKCCDECVFPHSRENYGSVIENVGKLYEKMKNRK